MDLQNAVNSSASLSAFTASYVPADLTNGTSGGYANSVGYIGDPLPFTTNVSYYHSYPSWCYHTPDNKTEKAYQVIRALMRAKVLKIVDLAKFFDAMDEVVKAL